VVSPDGATPRRAARRDSLGVMSEAKLADLVRDGVLDAELAGLVWLLAEARTPFVVVGDDAGARDRVLDAVAGVLPPDARLATVRPDDDFDWLREAVELGWRRERSAVRPVAPDAISSVDGVLVARDLGTPDGIAGGRARIVVRALTLGYGLLATAGGAGLDDVVAALADPSVGTDEDERSRLGVVLVLDTVDSGPRLAAAHYVRPVALDPHGHIQRPPPAVLATWNPGARRWDHFAWGVLAEIGARTGRTALEVEREQARRASALSDGASNPDV
jgi:hypothetical protein